MAEGEEASVQAKGHHDNVNWYHVLSSSGLCIFGFSVLDYKTLPDFLEAADGSKWTMAELEKIGHRIAMLRHIFNLKAGINPKDFKFPARVLGNPPLQSGETRGVSIDLEAMLKAYLKEAGFDTETAIPGKEVLAELGLSKYFYPAPLITLLTGCTRPRNFTSEGIRLTFIKKIGNIFLNFQQRAC